MLDAQELPYVIVTMSPDAAQSAEDADRIVLRGNYARRHELEVAGVRAARLLVVADDDEETTAQVVETVRALNPELPVLVRAHTGDPHTLRRAGASDVVSDIEESVARLTTLVLEAFEVPLEKIREHVAGVRGESRDRVGDTGGTGVVALTARERASGHCSHAADLGAVQPSAPGCEDCLRAGKRGWVHLRICMTCGHVGCCDSSPGTHATKHHHATGHPIVKSMEPGESWAWCYVDQRFL